MCEAARLRCLAWGAPAAALEALCCRGRDERCRNAALLAAMPPDAIRPSESRASRTVLLLLPLPAVLQDSPERVSDLLTAIAGPVEFALRISHSTGGVTPTMAVMFERRAGALVALALHRTLLGDAPLLLIASPTMAASEYWLRPGTDRKRSRSRSPPPPEARRAHRQHA